MLGAMARARHTAYTSGPIYMDVELETVLCGKHRHETMCKKYERKKRQNMDVSAQGRPAPAHEAFAV
jgi:hypothetical protein